jgi:hypothetical protein
MSALSLYVHTRPVLSAIHVPKATTFSTAPQKPKLFELLSAATVTVIAVDFFSLLCCIAIGLIHHTAVLQAAHNTTALATANRCQVQVHCCSANL